MTSAIEITSRTINNISAGIIYLFILLMRTDTSGCDGFVDDLFQ